MALKTTEDEERCRGGSGVDGVEAAERFLFGVDINVQEWSFSVRVEIGRVQRR